MDASKQMSADEIAAVRDRIGALPDGEWEHVEIMGYVQVPVMDGGSITFENNNRGVYEGCDDPECECLAESNHERDSILCFCASARTDIPRLLATIAERDERIREADALLASTLLLLDSYGHAHKAEQIRAFLGAKEG